MADLTIEQLVEFKLVFSFGEHASLDAKQLREILRLARIEAGDDLQVLIEWDNDKKVGVMLGKHINALIELAIKGGRKSGLKERKKRSRRELAITIEDLKEDIIDAEFAEGAFVPRHRIVGILRLARLVAGDNFDLPVKLQKEAVDIVFVSGAVWRKALNFALEAKMKLRRKALN
jgi:hypothetical protein